MSQETLNDLSSSSSSTSCCFVDSTVYSGVKSVTVLRIFVNPENPELKERYLEHAQRHNMKIMENLHAPDAGFDLLQPNDQRFVPEVDVAKYMNMETGEINYKKIMQDHQQIDFEIQCSAFNVDNFDLFRNVLHQSRIPEMYTVKNLMFGHQNYKGYFLFPRSSCSFTNLRLANSVGIIDSGYRGNLKAVVDFNSEFRRQELHKYERYFQICDPQLQPILVQIVDTFEQLGSPTERSTGGFGSTNSEVK